MKKAYVVTDLGPGDGGKGGRSPQDCQHDRLSYCYQSWWRSG